MKRRFNADAQVSSVSPVLAGGSGLKPCDVLHMPGNTVVSPVLAGGSGLKRLQQGVQAHDPEFLPS